MLVCHCERVNDRTIRKCAREGARNQKFGRRLYASTTSTTIGSAAMRPASNGETS